MAGFDFGKIFGRDTAAYQLFVYQVMGQFVATLGAPAFLALSQLVLSRAPVVPLSPPEAVDAAQKGHISAAEGAAEALLSGISRERFNVMLAAAQAPLGPQQLVVALRRGLIPEHGEGSASVSFEQGIREGPIGVKWVDVLRGLATELPTPTDALAALLEGQISPEEGRTLYEKFGGDPTYFEMLYNTRGSAPTPLELNEMVNRGVIPSTGTGPASVSREQGFLEGVWRNKWLAPYVKLAEYVAPPRTVTAMVRSGALTDTAALQEFKKAGMTEAMAEAMLADAHHVKLSEPRQLAKSIVDKLYHDRLIDAAAATEMYKALDYSESEIAFLLQIQDMQRALAALNQAIGRVHTLYVSRHVSRQDAVGGLTALGVPAEQQRELLSTWDIERGVNVKVLTAAEIASAFVYDVLTQDQAMAQLVALGYTPWRAWVVLSVRAHGALENPPPRDPEE